MNKTKVISPCKCASGMSGKMRDAFCKIVFTDNGRLTISGVVGPLPSGNCYGGAGQCLDEIRNGIPNEKAGWNQNMLDKLCDIWERWHLNDMRPYCEHQRNLGWDEMSKEKIKVARWHITPEASDKQVAAEHRAIACLKHNEIFVPTDEEVMYENLPSEYVEYNNDGIPEEYKKYYELRERDCIGRPMVIEEYRAHLYYNKTEYGFLEKPCPVCGYKFGSEWIKEEVPQDVIDWLFNLPDTYKDPAWI